jgi:hypothetical protein
VGAAKVAGRRLADGRGRPGVLTAIGSGEKLFALLPLALLSAASVAGLATNGDGDPAATPSPEDALTSAGPFGHQVVHRETPANGTPTSARPSLSETVPPVMAGEDTSPEAIDQEDDSGDETTAPSPQVEPSAAPTHSSSEADSPSPAPTPSPTTPPDATDDTVITRAEATVQCLASGISSLDLLALATCVEDLLG